MLILFILVKEEEDIAETSETETSEDTAAVRSGKRSGSMSDVPPPGAMVSQSTICHWLTAQALENMSETNRCCFLKSLLILILITRKGQVV